MKNTYAVGETFTPRAEGDSTCLRVRADRLEHGEDVPEMG